MKTTTRWMLSVPLAFLVAISFAACGGGSGGEEGEAGHAEEAGEHALSDRGEGGGEHSAREGEGEHQEGREGGEHSEGGGEHAEGGEHGGEGGHDEEGEESGVYIGASETWDVVRRGARLILSYDSEAGAFVGTVENTTEQTLCAIRVEVHLDSGTELGPTARVDVPAGQSTSVTLSTGGEAFRSYTAHPEMSACGG